MCSANPIARHLKKRGGTFSLPMNLPFVAADVRRRTLLEINDIRLVTSAATVQGFYARIISGKSLLGERAGWEVVTQFNWNTDGNHHTPN